MWLMSEGYLKLTRALEIAVINSDLTQREAGLLLSEIEWALLMDATSDEADRRRKSHHVASPVQSTQEPERQQKAS
jgi:hypothetical protein